MLAPRYVTPTLVMICLAMGLGCRSNAPMEHFSSFSLASSSAALPIDRLWNAAIDELRAGRFRLDRVDRQAGVVTTFPVGSQHFFEFWRHDVATRRDFWEATINPMRRWARVSIEQDGQTATGIAVQVHKERFSAPDRQFNASGSAYNFFGYGLPSTSGAESIDPKDERWIDVGRDPAMEHYLLSKILQRAGIRSVDAKS